MLERYLERIGIDPSGRRPDTALLRDLQVAHLMTVPFENLDVFHRRGVTTDAERSVEKIVERRRGGWCFELNGAFAWLLRGLGFDATNVSCRVHGDDAWGPDLDHCAVIVRVDGEPWFVDVGFGDNCMVPIPLREGDHPGVPRATRIGEANGRFVLAERFTDGQWRDQLDIDPAPRPMEAFTPRSTYLQTEPGLPWTAKPFATRATAADGSRVTLRNGLLRMRRGSGDFVDTPVEPSSPEWSRLLRTHFAIDDPPLSA